jgi:NAD(P)-dependent dehydrogenase (short-subunit alcohol dehydrogenase family)
MNRVLLLTGATANTAVVIAHHFAARGFDLAVTSRDAGRAEAFAKALEDGHGIRAAGYALDVTDADDVARVFAQAHARLGRLDALIPNSVDQAIGKHIFNTTPQALEEALRVNVAGVFLCCQQAARIMRRQKAGGAIVLMGSVQARGGVAGRTLYAATKGAVASLNRALAYELAEFGIRVNNLVAGAIHTPRWDGQSAEETARRRRQYPLGREATMEEVAAAAYFLATEASANMTGSELVMDAGLGACCLPYRPCHAEEEDACESRT